MGIHRVESLISSKGKKNAFDFILEPTESEMIIVPIVA